MRRHVPPCLNGIAAYARLGKGLCRFAYTSVFRLPNIRLMSLIQCTKQAVSLLCINITPNTVLPNINAVSEPDVGETSAVIFTHHYET